MDVVPANDPAMFPDQVSEGTASNNLNMVLTPNSSEG